MRAGDYAARARAVRARDQRATPTTTSSTSGSRRRSTGARQRAARRASTSSWRWTPARRRTTTTSTARQAATRLRAAHPQPGVKRRRRCGAGRRPHGRAPNPLLEIAVTIVVPALVLMQAQRRAPGHRAARCCWRWPSRSAGALWDGWRRRKLNWLSVVGVVSTLLTGGIGLLRARRLLARGQGRRGAGADGARDRGVGLDAPPADPRAGLRRRAVRRRAHRRTRSRRAQRRAPSSSACAPGTLLLAGIFFFSAVGQLRADALRRHQRPPAPRPSTTSSAG